MGTATTPLSAQTTNLDETEKTKIKVRVRVRVKVRVMVGVTVRVKLGLGLGFDTVRVWARVTLAASITELFHAYKRGRADEAIYGRLCVCVAVYVRVRVRVRVYGGWMQS